MKNTYNEIVSLLSIKGEKLGMNAGYINYSSENDPGPSEAGYTTKGITERIVIPDEYMIKSGASDAHGFLNWLKNQ